MNTQNKKFCFALIPSEKAVEKVYHTIIVPACEEAGWQSFNPDELKSLSHNPQKLIEHLFTSDAIVADLTVNNHDVLYLLGIAHTIASKTIMIIEKGHTVPFDISHYPCIFYEQTDTGLKELHKKTVEALRTIDEWSQHPSNPVQEYKPHNAFIPRSQLEAKILNKDREILDYQSKIDEIQKKLAETRNEIYLYQEKLEFFQSLRKRKV